MKSGKSYWTLAERSLKLIAVGLAINLLGTLCGEPIDFNTFRYLAVLQRLGIVFWICSATYKAIPNFYAFHIGVPVIAFGIWTLMTLLLIVEPGTQPFEDGYECPLRSDGNFSYFNPPECTAESRTDVAVLGGRNHLNGQVFDNEGIIGTFTTVVTCVGGSFVGTLLLADPANKYATLKLIGESIIFLAVGLGLHYAGVPISKNLWTPSFVFVCLAGSTFFFALFFWLIDNGRDLTIPPKKFPFGVKSMAACGKNPLALYVFHEVVIILLDRAGGYHPFYNSVFASWIKNEGVSSLVWSLFWGLGVVVPLGLFLDHMKWYWRM